MIIAEVGSNFKYFHDMILSIAQARQAGADAVKFQMFSDKDLYGHGSENYNFNPDCLPGLKSHADAQNIEFMCTAFSVEGLALVDPYVKRHKIASSEMEHWPLIKAALKTGKPLLISTGGHTYDEIQKTVDLVSGSDFTLLYCCNSYPSRCHDLNNIIKLSDTFSVNCGYSDHSIDIFTPYTAVEHYGAVVVEKHFTIDPTMDTPDADHSLDPKQFKMMCELIHGDYILEMPNCEEQDAKYYFNRRLVAVRPINQGDALGFGENIDVHRSKHRSESGISPYDWELVHGKRATKGYKPGDAIEKGGFL